VALPHEKEVVKDLGLWIPLQDKRQVDLIARAWVAQVIQRRQAVP